jgi:CheY-like chemotaxis protein
MEQLIFLVDDDPDDIGFLTEVISQVSSSSKCVPFLRPQEMFSILGSSAKKPDLIFMDINMGCVNGKECLKQIRNDIETSSIPVIICSTSKNLKDIQDCVRTGANYYLPKPTGWNEWKLKIEKIWNEFFPEIR